MKTQNPRQGNKKIQLSQPKCVQVQFARGGAYYTYITYYDFKRGDYAIVRTPAGDFECVTVWGFNEDYWHSNPHKCKWIVAKLDLKEFNRLCELPVSELIAATLTKIPKKT